MVTLAMLREAIIPHNHQNDEAETKLAHHQSLHGWEIILAIQ